MSCLRSFENIQVTEEIWSPEIENILYEAIKIYPLQKKKIMLNNGRIYGRNHLISLYIEKKTGKLRTQKQISSHIQVLLKRKDTMFCKIVRQPTPDRVVVPKCLETYGLFMNDSKRIGIRPPISIDINQILDDLQEELPMRVISSPRLAFLGFFSYLLGIEGRKKSTQLVALTTCVVEANMETIPFYAIKHLYDETLLNLIERTPIGSFFVLKRWMDLRIPLETYLHSSYQHLCSSIFYSDQRIDIEVNTIAYTFGRPVYSSVVKNFPVEKISTSTQTYYVYHTTHNCANFDRNLILQMAELRETHGTNIVSQALKNYSILVYFKDLHTQEVLLTFIQTFDCSESDAMYKFQRLSI